MDARLRFQRQFTDLRNKRGLTQTQLAKLMGYSSGQFISNWERGFSLPPIPALFRLEKILGVSADSLFNLVLAATLENVNEQMIIRFNEERPE